DENSHRYLNDNIVSPLGKKDDKYIVKEGNILLARTGASVGKSYLYNENDGKLYYAGFLIRMSVKNNYVPYFVFLQTLTETYNKWVTITSMRTGQQGINAKEYSAFSFKIPCLEEQQKIADFLSIVYEVISQSEAEVRNLEQQKKAAMQKIFSQEVRFKQDDGAEFPKWEEKEFGTTVMIERGGSPRPIKQYITNDEGYNWVKIGDAPEYGRYITHTAEKIKKSGLNKTRQVFKGDLILSNSMSFGKPYIMAVDGCIHDGWLLIRNNQNIYNLLYLCYLLGTEYMLKQYKSLAGGSTVNNLNKDLVSMTTVFVPCLEEQQKIADFLSAFDNTISYAKQELDKWKELKKGFMQKMLV
ncbi:MAG: restriction endonuclease subunit S, partial [Ruminococcus sp.]|nr:restriction endonuclease subunit S [Ruminococcus sp.]